MKIYGGMDFLTFIFSALHRKKWSTLHFGTFYPEGNWPGTYWIEERVARTPDPARMVARKECRYFSLWWESHPGCRFHSKSLHFNGYFPDLERYFVYLFFSNSVWSLMYLIVHIFCIKDNIQFIYAACFCNVLT
jgi:hypothetical protein